MSALHERLTRIVLQELTGQAYTTVEDQAAALAAAILNDRDGYAVVELPDAAGIAQQHIEYGCGAQCHYECCPPWVHDADTDVSYGLSEAREQAAALLAAADAAEAGA